MHTLLYIISSNGFLKVFFVYLIKRPCITYELVCCGKNLWCWLKPSNIIFRTVRYKLPKVTTGKNQFIKCDKTFSWNISFIMMNTQSSNVTNNSAPTGTWTAIHVNIFAQCYDFQTLYFGLCKLYYMKRTKVMFSSSSDYD